jgi:glucoamylase
MHAFGGPGIAPTWTSSAKDITGCALGAGRVWFTVGYGILNEVYHPRADMPQIRDLGFIVADDDGFWVEVKRLDCYRLSLPAPGIPAAQIVHTHDRFELRLLIVADPERDVVLVDLTLSGDAKLRPHALLAPHLGGSGHDNVACIGRQGARTMLWAEQGPFGLALAATDPGQADAWGAASAGYVGASDGWQDFARNGALTWRFDSAGPGNVALIGALPRRATLALGLGTSREAAATLAVGSLMQPFSDVFDRYVAQWRAWLSTLDVPSSLPTDVRDAITTSAMVMRVHQDKTYPGAMVASLSVPWGNTHGDIGGYHLVWPRDLVESAGGLLALGAIHEARNVLRYLIATQHADGDWSQNQWLGGKPFWRGEQLDETAFPVLLAAALVDQASLDRVELRDMVTRALGFIIRTGPASAQDRWEEDAGINAFTLAACVAALVSGAPYLDEPGRTLALDVADYWNACIEAWTSVRGTALARTVGVDGYYVRIATPPDDLDDRPLARILPIKNHACDPGLPAEVQVSTDFLQLVRFGLRDAHDPLVLDTVKVIDHQLKVDLPTGTAWHRYSGDGYGEHYDGSAFDGTGIGRAWPLLTGERGHYALVAGDDPLPCLRSMTRMTGRSGLMPEQVWDSAPIAEQRLFPGKPSGAAMPLVWAHAEFVKLAMSAARGAPCDRPRAAWERYRGRRPRPCAVVWTPRYAPASIDVGQRLRICLQARAVVHYGIDGWREVTDVATRDIGLDLHLADIAVAEHLHPSQWIDLTFFWPVANRWEGRDYRIRVQEAQTQ